jgi:MFS family permease
MADDLPPPGWYQLEGVLRFWDGERWTEHVRPLARPERVILPRDREPGLVRVLLTITLGILAALCWWGWFTWPTDGDVDYQVWQGVGCVLCLLALAIAAPVVVHPGSAICAMTIGFTIAVGIDWIPDDVTGLSGVGVTMLGLGMAIGSCLVILLADAGWHHAKPARHLDRLR